MKVKGSWIKYGVSVAALHLAGFYFLFLAARDMPVLWSAGLLAYTLGLRHAFDADHIAAIDNTVRKLVQQRQNPLGVGFYFSLGHSSVVFMMAIATALSVHWIQAEIPRFQNIGGAIGASVSGAFLLVIGIINLVILLNLYKLFLVFRKGKHDHVEIDRLLAARGFFYRLIRPLFRFVNKSWHVYPLGFLFGLGFDTASEIALLAIAAGAAKASISLVGILSLPLLFAAGMSLMDTADGIFMSTAYNWAFSTPLRKLYYNLTVTALAVASALLIGIAELSQVLSAKLGLQGSFWAWLQDIDFGMLGYILVALFVIAWAVSFCVWKFMRVEKRLN